MLEPLDYWRFHEEFTVVEAALLSLDISPSDKLFVLSDTIKPPNFHTVFSGFTKAIINNKLKATINYCKDYNGGDYEHPDWEQTYIDVNDLKLWMARINFKPKFFFPKEAIEPDYLNKDHSRYSEKLAAAVKVWLAMEDDKLTSGKGVISAMESWLTNNYKSLDLTHKQSNPKAGKGGYEVGDINNGAIKSIAKIANWNDKGGTPTTPTSTTTETKASSIPSNGTTEKIDNFKKNTEPYTPVAYPPTPI